MLSKCVNYIDQASHEIRPITPEIKAEVERVILRYARQSLRTLIAGFKVLDQLPPNMDNEMVMAETMEEGLTL